MYNLINHLRQISADDHSGQEADVARHCSLRVSRGFLSSPLPLLQGSRIPAATEATLWVFLCGQFTQV